MANTIWEVLGIPPTNDKKVIKKAYSQKCSSCHPEEHPDEFDQLHRAYAAALKLAAAMPSFNYSPGTYGSSGFPGYSGAPGSSCVPGSSGFPVPSGAPNPSVSPDCQDKPNESLPLYAPDAQPKPPASSPSLSISQLVEEGVEHERKSSCRKLLESLEALHASFPESINIDDEEYAKALVRLDEWFESPRFKLSGWSPGFLMLLNVWMSTNRATINRAEVVALYKAFNFNYYKFSSCSAVPHMDLVHWEVMFHAHHYEKDLILSAGMPPLPKTVEYKSLVIQNTGTSSRTRHARFMRIYMLIVLSIMIFITIAYFSQSVSSSSPQDPLYTIESDYLFDQETAPSMSYPDLQTSMSYPDLQPYNVK